MSTFITLIFGIACFYAAGALLWYACHQHLANTTTGERHRIALIARDNSGKYPVILAISFALKILEMRKKHRHE